ncbi:hypothetical protein [Streptomyces sp. NPDC046985]|uniref:hypothetical protein n=1 Tax=Streptomyces sp. NPDC046985 TaxID=3155377 RepID=UPI0033D05374
MSPPAAAPFSTAPISRYAPVRDPGPRAFSACVAARRARAGGRSARIRSQHAPGALAGQPPSWSSFRSAGRNRSAAAATLVVFGFAAARFV